MIRLTREQVRRIDQLALDRYKIPGIVLMENAARAAAEVAGQMLQGTSGSAMILCGGGNNGGDGLAVARHLYNRGFRPSINLTTDPAKFPADAMANWQIVQAMGLPVGNYDGIRTSPDLIIDAIFGTGLTQAPRDPFGRIVEQVAEAKVPVLAIDIPSGLDCDTGRPLGACIRANRTVTFVAEKIGFAQPSAAEFLGTVTVGDIGCPPELVQEVLNVPPASHRHS